MTVRRSNEPFFWSLFSSGGMISALVMPVLALVLWIAPSVGWMPPVTYAGLVELVRHPLVRVGLFVVISLSLFHWGHRFRFTLYDGLQLHHLFVLIALICYGGATVLILVAGYLLWTFP